jgi:hypothetical protein
MFVTVVIITITIIRITIIVTIIILFPENITNILVDSGV